MSRSDLDVAELRDGLDPDEFDKSDIVVGLAELLVVLERIDDRLARAEQTTGQLVALAAQLAPLLDALPQLRPFRKLLGQ